MHATILKKVIFDHFRAIFDPFKIPAVNIGTRQDGKYKPINVIDTGYSKESIYKGIKIATSKKFKKKLQNIKNLYESKLSEKKIVDFIVKLKVNDKLLRKKFINLKWKIWL